MRIGADAGKGEFGHVGLGDDDRAAGAQAAHHRRVARGRLAFLGEHFGAGARHLAGDVEQVLDRDDGAIERPERDAGLGAGVGGVGGRLRLLAIDGEAGARALALGIVDARQRGLEPLARGRLVHAESPPFSTMKRAISSTPCPVRRLVNTNGRCPRIFLASRSITSSEAPT